MADPYDAVVLAGGSARRLGGVDKPALRVGGVTLLDRVLCAVGDAERTVVVGPERPTGRPVRWTKEEPPGGGPVAALAAGLAVTSAPMLVLLAGDLPFLDSGTVRRLLDAVGDRDGALLVDDGGRDQLLVGAWRRGPLTAALPAQVVDARLGPVLGSLDAVRVAVPATPDRPAPWFDCDTDADLTAARGSA